MKIISEINHEIKHCLIIVLIIMAFAGYVLIEWPNDYGRVSRAWTETEYWVDKQGGGG